MAMIKQKGFKFSSFSKKQRQVLNWWTDGSPVRDYEGIIADGAIRSGKTIAMSLSYVMWGMSSFDTQFFGLCGKTIGSFRRNVLFWLKLMLKSRGYVVKDFRSDNYLQVTCLRTNKTNYFYIFGGKDERSQDLIQGITLAGCFFDEVALMPQSFVNQATGRCSVDGSKLWFNCNPDHTEHYFKKEWIDKVNDKRLLYLHFTMDDNSSLSESIKERYRSMYSGVFFKRYIMGLWVAAEGVLFPQYANDPDNYELKELPLFATVNIGVDIGGTKSHTPIIATGITAGFKQMVTFDEEIIKHSKGTVDVDDIVQGIQNVIERLKIQKIYPKFIFVDNAEQVIINSIRNKLIQRGYTATVRDCKKYEGMTRILFYTVLLNTERMKFYKCPTLRKSLSTVMYNAKKHKDEVLDDGTTDVDTYDAHFYSFSAFISAFGLDNREKGGTAK